LPLYASRFYFNHGREVFHGAFDFATHLRLLDADEAGLSDAYKVSCDRYVKK
jgi:hypothetical protein